jgi:hypothetical protein
MNAFEFAVLLCGLIPLVVLLLLIFGFFGED